MEIIYLPGNSKTNKIWIEKVKEDLSEIANGEILHYRHWDEGDSMADLEEEGKKLKKMVEGKKEYIVFAKSIGVLLALKCISEGKIKPQRAVFCGTPHSLGERLGLRVNEYLENLTIPTVFVHNENDMVISADRLAKILRQHSPANFRLIINENNSSHDYDDMEQLKAVVKALITSSN